jgi:hypothetical protein
VDYEGHLLFHNTEEEIIVTQTLDLAAQQSFRQKLPFLKDKDTFTIL